MKKMFTFVALLLGMSAVAMADPTAAPAAPTSCRPSESRLFGYLQC